MTIDIPYKKPHITSLINNTGGRGAHGQLATDDWYVGKRQKTKRNTGEWCMRTKTTLTSVNLAGLFNTSIFVTETVAMMMSIYLPNCGVIFCSLHHNYRIQLCQFLCAPAALLCWDVVPLVYNTATPTMSPERVHTKKWKATPAVHGHAVCA